jgi:hypothetical protein
LVEQRIENPRVLGSIPRRATSTKKDGSNENWGRFSFRLSNSSLILFVVIACGIDGDYAIMFASCNDCHCAVLKQKANP